jgi:hypothetical protein
MNLVPAVTSCDAEVRAETTLTEPCCHLAAAVITLRRTVLQRLFPAAPAGNPVKILLRCTGRAPLKDPPRRTSWMPKAAIESREGSKGYESLMGDLNGVPARSDRRAILTCEDQ